MSQPEDLLKQVFGEVLEGGFENKVADLSVLLVAMMAEIDEVLDVVVGSKVLDVLGKKDSVQYCHCSVDKLHDKGTFPGQIFVFNIF